LPSNSNHDNGTPGPIDNYPVRSQVELANFEPDGPHRLTAATTATYSPV
jgi:hypothetical protein